MNVTKYRLYIIKNNWDFLIEFLIDRSYIISYSSLKEEFYAPDFPGIKLPKRIYPYEALLPEEVEEIAQRTPQLKDIVTCIRETLQTGTIEYNRAKAKVKIRTGLRKQFLPIPDKIV